MAEMDRKTRRVSRRRSLFVDEKASAGEIMQVEDVDGFRFRKRTKKTVRLSFSQVEAAEKVPPEERGRETDAREKAPSVDRSAVNEQQPGNMEVHEGDFVALKQQAEKVEALTVAEHVTPDAEHMAEEVRQGAVKESVTEESHAEKNKNGDAQRTEQKNVEAKAANSESESPAADNAEAAPPSTTKRAPAIYQQTRPKERDNLNTSSLRPPSAGHSVFKRKPSQTENKRTSPSEICPELKETCSMLLQQGIESLMTSLKGTDQIPIVKIIEDTVKSFLKSAEEGHLFAIEASKGKSTIQRIASKRAELESLVAAEAAYKKELSDWESVQKLASENVTPPLSSVEVKPVALENVDVDLRSRVTRFYETLELRSDDMLAATRLIADDHKKQSTFWTAITSELSQRAFAEYENVSNPKALLKAIIHKPYRTKAENRA